MCCHASCYTLCIAWSLLLLLLSLVVVVVAVVLLSCLYPVPAAEAAWCSSCYQLFSTNYDYVPSLNIYSLLRLVASYAITIIIIIIIISIISLYDTKHTIILSWAAGPPGGRPGTAWAEAAADHTCHILPPSEIDLGLFFVVFTVSEGKCLFHRIGWKSRIWQLWAADGSQVGVWT